MSVPWKFILANLLLIMYPRSANSYFEFCSNGKRYTVNAADCPSGVLFQTPQRIDKCYQPTDPMVERMHQPSICDSGNNKITNTIQFVDPGTDDSESDVTCPCSGSVMPVTRSNSMQESDVPTDEDSDENDLPPVNNIPENPVLMNQTLRLFMHLTGNLVDENEGGPLTLKPLLDIFNQSFSIVQSRVDQRFLPQGFLQDIQKAFLFLFRESETSQIKPITKEDRMKIQKALDNCKKGGSSSSMPTLYFSGKICKTSAKVKSYAKGSSRGSRNHTEIYAPNELSFRWGGTRDFIEEAAWAVTDFVHGYCYGVFRDTVNHHHLYQRAMERLFTSELLFRWRNPQKLKQELYWDNVFSTNVKTAMRNLDAAVQAAYLDSPFLHRLKRPWIEMGQAPDADSESTSRKKRDTSTVPGWCIQDDGNKATLINKLQQGC